MIGDKAYLTNQINRKSKRLEQERVYIEKLQAENYNLRAALGGLANATILHGYNCKIKDELSECPHEAALCQLMEYARQALKES